MILLVQEKASLDQIQSMSEEYVEMIVVAVDIRLGFLAGGGEMHADCEQVLLEYGSEQDDIWGANCTRRINALSSKPLSISDLI
jgi:hypothetical protein